MGTQQKNFVTQCHSFSNSLAQVFLLQQLNLIKEIDFKDPLGFARRNVFWSRHLISVPFAAGANLIPFSQRYLSDQAQQCLIGQLRRGQISPVCLLALPMTRGLVSDPRSRKTCSQYFLLSIRLYYVPRRRKTVGV